jgi:hypothetical protein
MTSLGYHADSVPPPDTVQTRRSKTGRRIAEQSNQIINNEVTDDISLPVSNLKPQISSG